MTPVTFDAGYAILFVYVSKFVVPGFLDSYLWCYVSGILFVLAQSSFEYLT
jgi:hypothetical protein